MSLWQAVTAAALLRLINGHVIVCLIIILITSI